MYLTNESLESWLCNLIFVNLTKVCSSQFPYSKSILLMVCVFSCDRPGPWDRLAMSRGGDKLNAWDGAGRYSMADWNKYSGKTNCL